MDPTKPGPSGDDLPRCEICRPSFRRCCLCGQPGTLRSHSEHQICTGCLNSFSKFLHKELAGAMYPVDACKRLSCSAQKKHWVKATIDKRDNCVAHLLFFGKKLGMAAETIRRRKLTERAQARRRTKQACQSLQEVVSSQRTVFPEVDPLAPGPSCRSPPRTAQAARHVPAPAVRPTPEISRKATKNGQPQKEIEHIDLEAGLPAPPSRLPSRPPDSSSRPSTRPPEPALRPIQKGQATRKEVQQRVEPISDDAYQSDSRKQAVRFVTIGTTVKTVHRENPPAAVKMGHLNTKNATFPEREPSGNHKHRSRTHENQRDAGDSRQPPAGPLVEEPSSQPEPSAQLNQPREAVDQQPSDVVVSTSNPTNAEEAAQETSAHPPQLVEPVLSNCDPQSTTPPPMLSCPSRLSVVSTRQEPVRQPLDFILPRLISSTIQRPQEVPAPVNDVVVRRVDEPLSDQEEERRQESTEREVDVRENQKDGLEDVCSPGRSIGLFDFEGYEEPSPSVSVTEGGSPSSNGSSPRREKGNEDQEGEAPLDVLHRDALKLKATVARMRPPFWAVFERARERAEAEIAEQLRELEKAKEARVENGQPDVDNRNGDTSTSDSSCAGTPKDPEERKKREAEKEHLQQVALEANVSATVRQFLESGQLENIQLEADKTRKEDSSHVTEVDQNEPGPSGQDDVQSGTDNNEDFENLDLDHDYFARLPELRKRNRISGQDERQLTQDYCTQQTVENGAQESEMTGEVQEEQAAEEVPRMDKWQQENEKMTESGPVLENIDEGRRQKPMEPRVEDINSEQNLPESNGHPEVERTSQEDSSREQQPDGDDDDELEEIIDEEYDYDLQAAYLKVRRETSEEEESPLTSPNTSALTEVDEGEAEEAGPKGGRQLATAPDDDDDDEDSSDSSSDSSSSSDDSETTDYMEDWEGPEDSGSAVSSSAQNGREMSAPSIGKEPMVEVMVDVADGNDGSVEELDPIQEGLPVADEEDELMSPRSPSEYCPSEHCMYSPIATGSPIYSEGIYIPPGQEPLEITGEEGGEVVESGRCSPSPAWRSPTYHAWRGAPPAWRSPLFPAVQQQARCPASPVERRSLSPLVAPQLVSTCSQSKSSPRRIRRCSISAVWRAPSSSVIAFDLPTQEMLVSLSQNELERRYEFLRPGPSRQSTAPSWTIQTSRRSFRHHRDDQDEGFQWAVAQDIETNGAGRREDVEPVQRPNSFDYLLSKAENLLREEDVKPIDEREKWLTFMQTEVQPASPDSDIEILEPSPIIQEVDFSSLVDPLPDQAESTDVAAEEIDQSDGEQVRDLQDSLVEENLDRIYPEEVESCQKPEENATISQSPGKQRPPVDSLFVADPFLEPEKSINEDTLLKTGECQSGGKGILKVDEYRLWDLSTKRDLWAQLEEVAKFQRSKRESGKSVQAEPPSRRPAVCRRTISRAHNIRRERWRAPGAPSDDSGQLEQQAPKRGRPRKERQEVSTKGRPRKMSHSHQKRPRNEQTEVEEEGINPLECTENEQVLVDPYGDEQQEENSRRPTEAVNDQEAGDEIIVEATREDVQLDIQQETEDICQDQQIYIENGRHLANGERDQPKQKSPRKRTAKCDGDQQHPKRRSVKTRRMPLDGEKSGKMALVEDTEDDDEIEILEESSGETDDCQNISCSSSDVQMEGEDSDMENDQGDTISANREKRQNETVDLAQDSSRKRPAVEEDQLPSKRARRATRQRIEKGGNSKGTQSRQQRNKEGRHGDGQTSQKSDEKVQYIMKTDESYPCLGQQKPKPDEKNSHQPRPATISSKKSYNPLENKCTRCWRLPKQQGKEICLYCAYEKCLTCLHKICNCTSRESVPTCFMFHHEPFQEQIKKMMHMVSDSPLKYGSCLSRMSAVHSQSSRITMHPGSGFLLCVISFFIVVVADRYDISYPHGAIIKVEGDILTWNRTIIPGMMSSALRAANSKWVDARVPFHFHSSISVSEKNMINAAMEEIHEKSCVRFVEATNDHTDFVLIGKPLEGGCNSFVGRVGGKQILNLGPDCYSRGVILHELMHALGFIHEHNRADRDEYVTINWNMIKAGHGYNFEKRKSKDLTLMDTGYSYDSVMHYRGVSFSKDDKTPTILPKKTVERLGGGDQLSTIDVQRINRYYQCATTTEQPKKGFKWNSYDYNMYWDNGCDFYGHDIKIIRMSDVKTNAADCLHKCLNNAKCTHFTWNPSGCCLKSLTTAVAPSCSNKEFVCGVKGSTEWNKPVYNSQCTLGGTTNNQIQWKVKNFDIHWSYGCDFYGHDIEIFSSTATECMHKCFYNKRCTHFTYVPNGSCCLKSIGTADAALTCRPKGFVCGVKEVAKLQSVVCP